MHQSTIILLLAVAGAMFTATPARAGSIQLHAKANVSDAVVRLADVATLDAEAAEFAGLVVVRMEARQGSASLTLEALRRALGDAGVNFAKMTVKGFETCEISRADAEPAKPAVPAATIDAPPAPILSNPSDPVDADAQSTLRQRITDWLCEMHGPRGDSILIDFSDRDAKALDALIGQDKLVLTSPSAGNLGRVPITAQRFRGEKLVATTRLSLEVSQRVLAVVAVRPIARAAAIGPMDVEIREVQLDRDGAEAITRLDDAIGLVPAAAIREGAVLTQATVRPALLVRRGDLVRVRAIAGGLVIQTLARALEDGGEDQLVQVRNERSREVFAVRISGLRQATLVVDDAPAPAAPAAPRQ